jgi:hypothetical protein
MLLALAISPGRAVAADAALKLEAQLVWGTNDEKSPDPKHKPVEADIKKKLQDLPLKWTHYYEVNRKSFEVAASANKRIVLSDKCDIEVKNLGQSSVEVSLIGKGAQVLTRKQALPKGETLVVGGNAPNSTAWLVVLKRNE